MVRMEDAMAGHQCIGVWACASRSRSVDLHATAMHRETGKSPFQGPRSANFLLFGDGTRSTCAGANRRQ